MAVRLDAANDRLLAASFSGTAATVLCWVYISNDRNDFSNIWVMYTGTEAGGVTAAGLGSDTDGTSMLLYDSAFTTLTGPNMTAGTWYCFASVLSGTAWQLYYGTSAYSLTLVSGTRTSISSPGNFTISHAAEWLDGRVANWKVYTAALSAAEIQNDLAFYSPQRTANLLEFRPFINAELVDYSGNARTLTAGAGSTTTEAGPPIKWDGRMRHYLVQPSSAPAVANPPAGNAAFGMAAQSATIKVSPNVGSASVAMAAQSATARTAVVTVTGFATPSMSAEQPTIRVAPNVGSAAFTMAGQSATASTATTNPAAGNATIGLAAQSATTTIKPSVGNALFSMTARNAVVFGGTTTAPGVATFAFAARTASTSILVHAGLASVGLVAGPVISGNLQLACANLSATITLDRLSAIITEIDRHSGVVTLDLHAATVGMDEYYADVGICGRS